jgi:colanic acid biosynthesis glycosyl transferase WcaI
VSTRGHRAETKEEANRPLRVLITTQVFPPEDHPTAVMAAELARGLVHRGWEVTVAAGLPHHPTGLVPEGFSEFFSDAVIDGYRLLRCWHPTAASRKIAARASVMACQTLAIAAAAARAGRQDIALSFAGPPLLGPIVSGFIAGRWRIPQVSAIFDVYPDVAIESGKLKGPLLIAAVTALERLQYRLSNKLLVLGEASRRMLVDEKHLSPDDVEIVPVWLDPDVIRPMQRSTRWRRENGIEDDRFVVLYSGTAGIVSGAEILLDVLPELPAEVLMVVVGGGSAWETLGEQARHHRRNLLVLPYQPRDRLSEVQASADLSLVTLAPGRGRTSVPSKVQGYMAAGRPVLAAVDADCDTALLVKRGQFGMVVLPGSARAIVDGIEAARLDPERLRRWRAMARETFEKEFSRDAQIDRLDNLLRDTANAKR